MDHSASAATKDAARFWRRRSCTQPRFSSTLPTWFTLKWNESSRWTGVRNLQFARASSGAASSE